jgi:hypothetical protein
MQGKITSVPSGKKSFDILPDIARTWQVQKARSGRNVSHYFRLLGLLIILLLSVGQLSAQNSVTLAPGTTTFTVPDGVTGVMVEVWAGGGRGSSRIVAGLGGGGGGGGYSKKILIPVEAGNEIPISIGGGSASGTAAGGDTWFLNTATVLARGGNSAADNATAGAAGGAVGTGDLLFTYKGGNGATAGITSGGGGSSAGTGSPGNNGNGILGGAAVTGGGGGGAGGALNAGGTGGSNPGGGGGGASKLTGTGTRVGGSGGAGKMIISWPIPTISQHPASIIVCNGGTINLSVTSAGATSFQWYKDGDPIPSANSATYNLPLAGFTDAGIYSVAVINGYGALYSNEATVTVNDPTPAAVSISASATTICAGTNVTFDSGTNGGIVTGQWKVNGAVVGTGASYSSSTLTNNAVVTYTMNTASECLSGLPFVSEGIVMTVNPLLPASVVIAASATTICVGDQVTFTATPTNGGTTPVYQWKIGAANVGTNSPIFTTSALVNNNVVTCVMTSNATPCSTGSPATSTGITITVNPVPTSVTLLPPASSICQNSIQELLATGGVSAGYPVVSSNFNGGTTFTPAPAGGTNWAIRADGFTSNTLVFHSSDNTAFEMAYIPLAFTNTSINTQLTSPIIDTNGYTALSLSFNHSYRHNGATSSAKVEVSVNGGAWAAVPSGTYTTNQNGGGSDQTFTNATLNLNSYINQSNLRIRFSLVATVGLGGYTWWGIDNVSLTGTASNTVWSPITGLYTNPAATVGYTGTPTHVVYAKPAGTTTYTATSTSPFGCGTTNSDVVVTVNLLPTVTAVVQPAVCENSNAVVQLSGLVPLSVSTVSYKINSSTVVNVPNVTADASGNASFNVGVILANDDQILQVTNILRTDVSPTCSVAFPTPNASNSVALQVNKNETYYIDNDDDGFGNVAPTTISCFGVPEGYSANKTDCDDSNAAAHERFLFYVDNDDDGYGVGLPVSLCSPNATVAPDGYAVLFGDCDDDDAASHQTFQFYIDADEDNYGDKNGTLLAICAPAPNAPPLGYSVNNGDCRDDLPAVHPNAIEVGYNLIDDDCDTLVDEGFPPKVTSIQGAFCNVTLPVINTYVYANLVAGAQGYRWRVTKLVGGSPAGIQEIDTQLRAMRLTQLADYAFDTAYKIEVAVYYAGFLQAFTPSNCVVRTPATTTKLSTCATGAQLNTISDVIYADIVPFATGYRFKVYAADNPGVYQEIERQLREFRMPLITAFPVRYGKTYLVESAIRNTDGVTYLPYGPVCSVTTPLFPTTSIQSLQCDNGTGGPYPVPNNTTQIYASSFPGAIAYAFKLEGEGLPAVGSWVVKQLRAFTLNDFSGVPLIPGATYNVSVRLIFNLADPEGPYGKVCTLSTPGISREIAPDAIQFNAMGHPNPFSEAFNLYVNTGSKAEVSIKVYDMTGRLLETRVSAPDEVPLLDIGIRYPSGVFIVIIGQGDETKAMRIVKR